MGWRRSEAFVLRAIPLGESDRIVTLFTRECGKVRAVAKNARRSRTRFGAGLELLTRVQAAWFEKEGAPLARLDHCEILESCFDLLQSSLEVSFLLNHYAEIADSFSHDHEPDERFFRLLAGCLAAARRGGDVVCLARYIEFWTLRLHGLLPEVESCPGCGRPLDRCAAVHTNAARELACARCVPVGERGRVRLRGRDVKWIRELLRAGPAAMCAGSDLERPGAALAAYARREIEAYLERSLRTWRFLPAEPARK
jgi:DNA repair protein RecO (recombination protein O)